ncbi:MAG: GGDEF domain-containing protein [Candidatus Omnitrophota bacterium]
MPKAKFQILNSRFIRYMIFFSVIVGVFYAVMMHKQSNIMCEYFTAKPNVNQRKAEEMARFLCLNLQSKLDTQDRKEIKEIIEDYSYNRLPALTIDFVCDDGKGTMRSILQGVKDEDLFPADYIFPIENKKIKGKLIVYDMYVQLKNRFEEDQKTMRITMFLFIINTILLLTILVYREYSDGLIRRQKFTESKRRDAEYRTKHDSMTGLCNQTFFKKCIDEEIKKSVDFLRPIVLIMCDIDHFKKFNDTYGHLAGDNIIKTVARAFRNHVRAYDFVARYGGEEFAVLFLGPEPLSDDEAQKNKDTFLDKTISIAFRLKKAISDTELIVDNSKVNITVSMGISAYCGEEGYDSKKFIREADNALYQSKNSGRDRITVYKKEN